MSKTILPSQTGAAGKFLKSDGTDATFETIGQSDVSGLGTSLANKADLTYVDAQLAEKANKTQEEWITGTLLNGFTGALKYRKDEFGVVWLSGLISGGAGLIACQLPVGYRPTEVIRRTCTNATINTVVHAVSYTNGTIYINAPSGNQTADLSCFSYSTF